MDTLHLEMHHEKSFKATMIAFLLFFLAGAVYRVTYSADPGFPPENTADVSEWPTDDLIILSRFGVVHHYDAATRTFTAKYVGKGVDLTAAACGDPDLCWAISESGMIFHYNGTGWAQQGPWLNALLNGISCGAPDDCWVVGLSGTFVHYDGTAWTKLDNRIDYRLQDVSCVSADDCWAVGEMGTILRYNGTAWSEFAPPWTYPALYGVNCDASDSCLAVGDKGTILKFDGDTWTKKRIDPSAHLVIRDNNCDGGECMAVGEYGQVYVQYSNNWYVFGAFDRVTHYNAVHCEPINICWVTQENQLILFKWKDIVKRHELGDYALNDIVKIPKYYYEKMDS